MRFFNIFRSKTPEVVKRLDEIRTELDLAQTSIVNIMAMNERLSVHASGEHSKKLLQAAAAGFGIAMWVDNRKGRFIYDVNHDNLALRYETTDSNCLHMACIKSEQAVIRGRKAKRFIDCGKYGGRYVFLDMLKSPVYSEEELIGMAISGYDITHTIPDEIKEKLKHKFYSIEIPMEVVLCEETIKDCLIDNGNENFC